MCGERNERGRRPQRTALPMHGGSQALGASRLSRRRECLRCSRPATGPCRCQLHGRTCVTVVAIPAIDPLCEAARGRLAEHSCGGQGCGPVPMRAPHGVMTLQNESLPPLQQPPEQAKRCGDQRQCDSPSEDRSCSIFFCDGRSSQDRR